MKNTKPKLIKNIKHKKRQNLLSDIKYVLDEYSYEKKIINSQNYCPCELCDGLLLINFSDKLYKT